jgi:hypothetical protein
MLVVIAVLAQMLSAAELVNTSSVAVLPDGSAVPLERGIPVREGAEPVAIWSWSDTQPPLRMAFKHRDHEPEWRAGYPLKVHVIAADRRGTRIVAAPVVMWEEVPEDLLPFFDLTLEGVISVPRTEGELWRIRAITASGGSSWIDVPSSRREVRVEGTPIQSLNIVVLQSGARPPKRGTMQLRSRSRSAPSRLFANYSIRDGEVAVAGLPRAQELVAVVSVPGSAPAARLVSPHESRFTIQVKNGIRLVGRIAEADGRPVPDVEMTAEGWFPENIGEPFEVTTHSRGDGTWELPEIPDANVVLLLRAPGFVPTKLELEGSQISEGLHLVMHRAVGARIRVIDDRGTPVAGAVIERPYGEVVASDSDGVATLPDLPSGERTRIWVTKKGYITAAGLVEPPRDASVTLRRGVRVTGRYLNSDITPVPGARRTLRVGRRESIDELPADGAIDLTLEPETRAELELTSPDGARTNVTIDAAAPGTEHDLGDVIARSGMAASGTVISSATGQPLAGARVWLPRLAGHGPLLSWALGDIIETLTDREGNFRLQGLERLPGLLRIDAAQHSRIHARLLPAESGDVDLGPLRLGQGAEVTILCASCDGATARIDLRGEWLDYDFLTAAFENGKAVFRHVGDGNVIATVITRNRILCERRLTIKPEDDSVSANCDVKKQRVAGTVSAGGRPASGMLVFGTLVPDRPSLIMRRVTPSGLGGQQVFGHDPEPTIVVVDREGKFETTDLGAGEWSVVWMPDSGGAVAPRRVIISEKEEEELHFVFQSHAMRGLVVDESGQPVARARVLDESSTGYAFSAPDGTFEFAALEPGAHRLRATTRDLVSPTVTIHVPAVTSDERVVLVLESAEQSYVLKLQIADDAGEPAAGAFAVIETERGERRMLTADGSGRIETAFAAGTGGTFRIAASHQGSWYFGAWLEESKLAFTQRVRIRHGGTIVAQSEKAVVPIDLVAPGGWPLRQLFSLFGVNLIVRPDWPLQLAGLPPGTYVVTGEGIQKQVSIHTGEVATVVVN